MASNSERVVAAAQAVARFLDSIGKPKLANDIRALCRSNDASRAALSQLHHDNMQLRTQLAGRAGSHG